MKMRASIPALQGRNMTARGEAPGNASPKPSPALKGRHNLPSAAHRFPCANRSALAGRENLLNLKPGALPRAITSRPFRAAETQRLANLYEHKFATLAALKKSLMHQAFTGEL